MATHMAIKVVGAGAKAIGAAKVFVFTWPHLRGYEGGSFSDIPGLVDVWNGPPAMFAIPAGTPHDMDALLNRWVEVGFDPQPVVYATGKAKVSLLRWKKTSGGTWVEDGSFTVGLDCQGFCAGSFSCQTKLTPGSSTAFKLAKKQLEEAGY